MNKYFFGLVVGLSLVSCNNISDSNDKKLKNEAMEACESNVIQASMGKDEKAVLKSYCNCSTDKMIGEFSTVELIQLNNPSPELNERVMKLIAPCIKELEIKRNELKLK